MNTADIRDFPYQADPEPLFAALRRLPGAIWFDSGKPRSLQGRYDILTAAPVMEIETIGPESRISAAGTTTGVSTRDPFALAAELLKELGPVTEGSGQHPFVGGLAGYFGYDLGRDRSPRPAQPAPAAGLADMRLGCYTWALVLNHQSRHAWLIFHPACSPQLKTEIVGCLQTPQIPDPQQFRLHQPFRSSITRQQYRTAIARIREYIAAGDCYQVNFAQHFSAAFDGDSWQAYRQLRRVMPSPYSAFMQWQDKAVLCLSPERFVKVARGQVEAKPIKGTITRGASLAEDQENAIQLVNSSKDRAENLMIVDLLRNDLGKVCAPGSIRVPKLFDLESFANVHHLVSTVTGSLDSGRTPLDLLSNAFPGGSITGAPKKRAMEIIEETEAVRRNLYCGSIGYVSCTGRMDTNIAIRTLLADNGHLHCWGGGGIVADSDADSEYRESVTKVHSLMAALEALSAPTAPG